MVASGVFSVDFDRGACEGEVFQRDSVVSLLLGSPGELGGGLQVADAEVERVDEVLADGLHRLVGLVGARLRVPLERTR